VIFYPTVSLVTFSNLVSNDYTRLGGHGLSTQFCKFHFLTKYRPQRFSEKWFLVYHFWALDVFNFIRNSTYLCYLLQNWHSLLFAIGWRRRQLNENIVMLRYISVSNVIINIQIVV